MGTCAEFFKCWHVAINSNQDWHHCPHVTECHAEFAGEGIEYIGACSKGA